MVNNRLKGFSFQLATTFLSGGPIARCRYSNPAIKRHHGRLGLGKDASLATLLIAAQSIMPTSFRSAYTNLIGSNSRYAWALPK